MKTSQIVGIVIAIVLFLYGGFTLYNLIVVGVSLPGGLTYMMAQQLFWFTGVPALVLGAIILAFIDR